MVVAQTVCLLGVVAVLEVSTNRPERSAHGRGETHVGATRWPGKPRDRRRPRGSPVDVAERPEVDDDADFAAWLGERLRRLALGLTATLIVGPGLLAERATAASRQRLVWVLAMLVVAAVAIMAGLLGGDVPVPMVVGRRRGPGRPGAPRSALEHHRSAADRRPAINLAWEWGAIGLAYFLVRNLPRTRGESATLAGALVATAVAVAAYGLYQVAVELPER